MSGLNLGARRSSAMAENYSKFLEEAAEELRSLAGRAPDIAGKLRRFADDLDRMASGVRPPDRTSPEADPPS